MRKPTETLKMSDRLYRDDIELKGMAKKINRFLDEFRPPSISLADADPITMATQMLSNLWHGGGARPEEPGLPAAAAPVVRDGDVLFVCPECGFRTDDPGDQPPYECGKCSKAGDVVLLQDRTPGRTIMVACACGTTFWVSKSFAGTKRPCPKCGAKCGVEPAAAVAPKRKPKPPDTAFRDEGG
jgi:ssDNA-binding Zn-finger/Zn-ribbon topoisomerase 1